jgi:hypothetical protein
MCIDIDQFFHENVYIKLKTGRKISPGKNLEIGGLPRGPEA